MGKSSCHVTQCACHALPHVISFACLERDLHALKGFHRPPRHRTVPLHQRRSCRALRWDACIRDPEGGVQGLAILCSRGIGVELDEARSVIQLCRLCSPKGAHIASSTTMREILKLDLSSNPQSSIQSSILTPGSHTERVWCFCTKLRN